MDISLIPFLVRHNYRTAVIRDIGPGHYEIRVPAVDCDPLRSLIYMHVPAIVQIDVKPLGAEEHYTQGIIYLPFKNNACK